MKIEHVKGENKGKITLYALSTCGWCKKTKKLLDDLGVEYHYIYVDHLEGNEKKKTLEEIMKWNPRCSFPTVVINNKKCIVGFKEEKIKEALVVMNKHIEVNGEEVGKLYEKLNQEAESSGYHLNPDTDFAKDLISGLLVNEQRYGYWACPCRLASGNKSEDIDIICPCDYRDADLNEHGMCYCALYVSKKVLERKQEVKPIPERRPSKDKKTKIKAKPTGSITSLSKPVWRCKVCGYLCGRDEPPEICPICKAKKERFERFM